MQRSVIIVFLLLDLALALSVRASGGDRSEVEPDNGVWLQKESAQVLDNGEDEDDDGWPKVPEGSEVTANFIEETGTVKLFDGTLLPSKLIVNPVDSKSAARVELPLFIIAHGLKGHMSKVETNMKHLLGSLPVQRRPNFLVYDSRGSGRSKGWEQYGTAQFHWHSLAVDMLQVAASHQQDAGGGGYVLGGFSMGAATAIWAAVLAPRIVRGLVLCNVPTIWHERDDRREELKEQARRMRRKRPHFADVLMGAALADLPPEEELRRLKIPMLIVSSRTDPVHPAKSAEVLQKLFKHAKVVIVDSKHDLQKVLEKSFAEWLPSLD